MTEAEFRAWMGDEGRRCLVMGVLNVTPDSFSDGGRFFDAGAAREAAERMCQEGAEIIDIGGESTRPGAGRVDVAEQIRRIMPVFKAIGGRVGAVLSVDTTRAAVAEAALDAGASIVNDISAGRDDGEMLGVVGKRGAGLVLMHMQGEPATMQTNPQYENVVEDVTRFLEQRMEAALAAGVNLERILLDPGIGFGKTLQHNLELLRQLRRLRALGRPVVVGTSRKGFIGQLTGEREPSRRMMGTAASVAWSVINGAAVVRVHDVGEMVQVVRVVQAIQMGRVDP
ncbi:MAG: dihydropteroate synthase [Planctomycetota bacterium]|nr:dihydropteroate synthase [Planctomycetota bacterium]